MGAARAQRSARARGLKKTRLTLFLALAARGAAFERTYTASPLCVPSRAATFTGRYPSDVGAWDNGAGLREGSAARAGALDALLIARGYDVALLGKTDFVRNQTTAAGQFPDRPVHQRQRR